MHTPMIGGVSIVPPSLRQGHFAVIRQTRTSRHIERLPPRRASEFGLDDGARAELSVFAEAPGATFRPEPSGSTPGWGRRTLMSSLVRRVIVRA